MKTSRDKTLNTVALVCRLLLGLTFVFSGFVKSVDPWGTALKIGEYLNIYGASSLADARMPLAILFCAAELTLGLMLVAGIKIRLTSIVTLCVMAVFLVVTFLSATVLPVEDCGCFGDALHLSPWASFGKNVVLFALAALVWWHSRSRKILPVTWREVTATALLFGVSLALNIGSYRHLPPIDFLPFKKGLNLRDALYGDNSWDTDLSVREFVLFNSSGDATEAVVGFPGRVYVLCAASLSDIGPGCTERFETITSRAASEGAKVVLVTSSPLSADETMAFGTPALTVPVYNMGSGTMITLLRAKTGMIVLEEGVITDKKSCRDIK